MYTHNHIVQIHSHGQKQCEFVEKLYSPIGKTVGQVKEQWKRI